MRSQKGFGKVFTVAAMVVALGVAGTGTWAYAQNTDSKVPVGENITSMDSRIGGTMRGHGPTDSYEESFTVQPGSVPMGENTTSADSRIGGTMRGHGPTDSYEKSFTVQPGEAKVAENMSSMDSRIGGTMRGHGPTDSSK